MVANAQMKFASEARPSGCRIECNKVVDMWDIDRIMIHDYNPNQGFF